MSAGGGGGEERKKHKKSISESKRSIRNLNEQKRRNRFNALVDELAQCVLSRSSVRKQKLEKSAILELAVNSLRESQGGQKQECSFTVHGESSASRNHLWQPSLLSDGEFIQIMQESMDGFTFVLDPTGKVLYVSDGIFLSLGLTPDQLLNSSILKFVHKEDQATVLTHLKTLEKFQSSLMQDKSRTLSFTCRIGNSNLEPECFVPLNCLGRIFPNPELQDESTGHHGDLTERHGSVCLVVVGKLAMPSLDKTLFTAIGLSEEFSYRLTMDWKYAFVDHDAAFIIGFLPVEMIQMSAYTFIHPDDLNKMALYHEMIVHLGQLKTCYYRQITKGGTWIWLRSTCHVSYNQWNSKPDAIVCKATIATYAEVCANQQEVLNSDTKRFSNVMAAKIIFHHSNFTEHPGNLMTRGNVEVGDDDDDVSISRYMSSSCANGFTTDDERGPGLQQHASSSVNNGNIDTLQSPQQLGEICLPNPNLTRGLTHHQLKMHNIILLEQSQKIQELIQNKEQQLLMIEMLMEWNKQLLDMFEKVVDAAT